MSPRDTSKYELREKMKFQTIDPLSTNVHLGLNKARPFLVQSRASVINLSDGVSAFRKTRSAHA